MSVRVIVRHDPGCKHARLEGGGHSDAARRLADTYNLHKACGAVRGWIAVALADGSSDGDLYDSRQDAVRHQHHGEHWHAYIRIQPGGSPMTVCEAEAVMRFQRQASRLRLADRDDKHGGLEVIPRLTTEDQERQIDALAGRIRMPVALGYAREQ